MKKYLVFDIGGTNIKYSLITEEGRMLFISKHKTPKASLDEFLSLITKIAQKYLKEIDGIAFSVPGKIDVDTGTIYFGGALPYLDGLCLKQFIEESFSLPCRIQNDAKAAALAEQWKGSLQHYSNAAVLVLGTGVGGGIIMDGKLRTGPHFQAGEVSMSVLDASQEGPLKMTGYIGSAVEMVKKINSTIGNPELCDGVSAFQLINEKDERIYPIFQKYCRTIAYLILNLQVVCDLTAYAIGGGISAQPIVVEEIRNQFNVFLEENPLLKLNIPKIEIFPTTFNNDSNLYGALYTLLLEE